MSPAETVIEAPRLRTEVRSFIARELAAGSFEPTVDSWMRSLDRSFSERLGENGWLGVTWPAEYGGGEAPNVARLAITEELLRAGAPVAAHWIAERQIGPAVLRYGTDELKREFLPRIAAGGLTFCLGMSETESGSDLAAVRTTARRDGEDFVVEGTKIWTTNAHEAQYAYVLACTDNEAEKDARLTELIVAMDDPQVEVRPIYDLAGKHDFNEVIFDGARTPARWVIGEVGQGWRQVTAQLSFERGGPERFLSTYPLLAALADAHADDPAAAATIGALLARLRSLRALAWQVATRMDAGEAPVGPAAMLKMLGTKFEQDAVEAARALTPGEPALGGEGIGGMIADAQLAMPGISLRGGATEILSGIVARSLGGAA